MAKEDAVEVGGNSVEKALIASLAEVKAQMDALKAASEEITKELMERAVSNSVGRYRLPGVGTFSVVPESRSSALDKEKLPQVLLSKGLTADQVAAIIAESSKESVRKSYGMFRAETK